MQTLPQATGPLENALRVLLNRQLASSRIPDYLSWVGMNFATHASSRSTLEIQLEQETKCEPEQAAATLDGLIALGLLDDDAHPTLEGQRELVLDSSARERCHRSACGRTVRGRPRHRHWCSRSRARASRIDSEHLNIPPRSANQNV